MNENIIESAQTVSNDYKQPSQMAVAVSFWATILLFFVAYIAIAVYSQMPLPIRLVVGTSMEPTLRAGDIIMLKSMPFSQIKKGDLVAYRSPDAVNARAAGKPDTILHRVIGVDKDGRSLITKGDNSRVDPWPITPEIVRGKQVLRIPAIGKPVLLLTGTKGGVFFSSIAVTAAFLILTILVYTAYPVRFRKASRNSRPVSS